MLVSSDVRKSPWTAAGVAATIARAMAEYRAQVGARLRDLREAQDLSQEDAAHELHVTAKTLSRWENGRRWPTPANWKRIREFFGSDPREGIPNPGPLALGKDAPADSQPAEDLADRLTRIEEKLDRILRREPLDTAAEIHRAFEDYASRLGREVGKHPPRSRVAKDPPPEAPPAAA